jgi:hypothetical protein
MRDASSRIYVSCLSTGYTEQLVVQNNAETRKVHQHAETDFTRRAFAVKI